jgi:plasmid stabilization system protein ParE
LGREDEVEVTSRLKRLPLVKRDLDESADYIAQGNTEAALRFYEQAEAAFQHAPSL